MHVGGVRTALYAWLYARKHGGQFILRIEDTDKGREVEGSIGHIMESLKWLLAVEIKAYSGQDKNQSMVVQFTRDGKVLSLLLKS